MRRACTSTTMSATPSVAAISSDALGLPPPTTAASAANTKPQTSPANNAAKRCRAGAGVRGAISGTRTRRGRSTGGAMGCATADAFLIPTTLDRKSVANKCSYQGCNATRHARSAFRNERSAGDGGIGRGADAQGMGEKGCFVGRCGVISLASCNTHRFAANLSAASTTVFAWRSQPRFGTTLPRG